MLDEKTIRKVARLARIKVTDEDVTRLTPQVGGIMKWIEQLAEVNTDNVAPLPSPVEINARLRPDVVDDGNVQDKVLANAPESLEGFYVVPKVVE
ncbi:MAG: Asp-tRNA(Asn)/Glu-tRNA(Gln) amidotransferase subunit GatC [Alphaproteobacteria bacterium]|nr:Asp-tRNA(Asn)/Glu-tRNA(Gln) amidotransferase subunit GatC [Alphaproteobacteria bacterium]